jgi:hypothetical protein
VKHQTVLVSLCNLPNPSRKTVLRLELSFDGGKIIKSKPVNLGFPGLINSATGLAMDPYKIFILFWAKEKFHISVLDRYKMVPIFYQELPEIKDGHSVLSTGKKLYVISTGTDEIIRYDISNNKLENPKTFWRADDAGKDTHHINSIVKMGDDLYISAFGPKSGKLWSSASNGYIYNITRKVRIKEGIYHPHSLSERNGQIYYCESSTRSFCSLDGPILKLDGYTRGIGWLSDKLVCISSSIGRKISKSTGLIANSADPGEIEGKSGIVIRNIENQEIVAEVDLSMFGPEIYDVLVV